MVERLLWYVVATTVIVTPLLISPSGEDVFRLAKELVVRAAGILLLTIAGLGILWRTWRPDLRFTDPPVVITISVVAWTLLTALLSTNHLLSTLAAIRVCALGTFFLTAYLLVRNRSLWQSIIILLLPAVVNASLALAQELYIWNPFTFEKVVNQHLRSTALVGNVNDVGSYLIIPTLVAIVIVLIDRTRARTLSVPTAALLLFGLVLNQTLTALAAFSVGVVALALIVSPGRFRLPVAVVLVIAIVGVFVLFPPLRERVQVISIEFHQRRYDDMFSSRLPAFAAAVAMVEQYPLTGVGPGCFGFHYYFFRLRMEQRHPFLLTSLTRMQNFGEAHNDHLQIAAESGLPGYVLLLIALGYVASLTFIGPPSSSDARMSFVRAMALPLSVSLFVLMLAGFPFQLAAPTTTILYVSAMCAAWRSLPADETR